MSRLMMFGFCLFVGLSGCSGNTAVRGLDAAEARWQSLKTDYGNDYRFIVNASSVFGPSYETTLTVQADRVVQRDLVVTEIDNAGNTTRVESWSETGDALGTHDAGAELKTIDERYAACRADLETANLARSSVTINYVAPTNAEPTRDFVLASCLILPKGVVYDGGAEVVVSLEFLQNATEQGELGRSLETWQTLKAQNGNHYRYKTRFVSFAG